MSILICGLSNAGKTTYSQHFKNVIHYDEVPGTTRQKHEFILEQSRHGEICVEGVYGERFRRAELASAMKGKKICIWLDTPVDVCKSRENFRGSTMFEPVTKDEGWDEVITLSNMSRT